MNFEGGPYHIFIVQREFARRKEEEPRFSLRSFARALDIDPSALSRLLRHQQQMTVNTAALILKKFNLTLEEKTLFIESVAQERWSKTVAYLQDVCKSVQETLEGPEGTES